ncbi:MAG: metalloregulator ArsR/SmtB family transcription factor [Acidimicrobiia bacterium]|nr:metalloregulator ArsR/SmtB family transcription factor [Acidimicrobiia bacterium]
MVELINPETRVRDLTSAPRQIPIEVDGSVAYESLLSMWTTFNPKEKATSFDLGAEWKKKITDMTPDDLRDEIVALGGPYCHTWLAIAGLVATAPHPHDPDSVLNWLSSMDPMRLRRWLIGYVSHNKDASLIEQAASGDITVLPDLLEDDHQEFADHLAEILQNPDDDLPARFANAAQRFRREVFAEAEVEFGAAINRAAAARKAVATRDSAKAVIEDVTNGLDYDIPLGVTRVVLVPSVVVKPLSLIDQHRETLLVFYAVADEFIDSDPEAPPSWLVRTYKALSDERRLRILRRLSEGETTLDEITEMLGLSKSTVHHHISILRAAGLVRVRLTHNESGAKCSTYNLRDHSLTDASAFLDSYIKTTTQKEAQHA